MLAHNGTSRKFCECGCGTSVTHRFVHGHNNSHLKTLETRFWEKVNKNVTLPNAEACAIHSEITGTQCWEWTGGHNCKGYGVFKAGSCIAAHRVSWFIEHGKYPNNQCLHKCDNRSCVRPLHLFEGTNEDNVKDRELKGRNNPPCGEKQGIAKLTSKQVLEIRKNFALGVSMKVLSENFSTVVGNISNIVRGVNWKHLLPKGRNNE